MPEVDFLPEWYPRMRRNRTRMIAFGAAAAGALLLCGVVVAAWYLLV